MGYISDIRKYVGHMPVQHTAASVIVENEKGEILLQKRTDNGSWSYCGGAVELFEETGLTAESLELFGVFSGEEQHYIYPNGDEVSTIDILYICRRYSGEMKCQPEEVEELRFFDIDHIPHNICPPVREPIRKYIEYRRGAMF